MGGRLEPALAGVRRSREKGPQLINPGVCEGERADASRNMLRGASEGEGMESGVQPGTIL